MFGRLFIPLHGIGFFTFTIDLFIIITNLCFIKYIGHSKFNFKNKIKSAKIIFRNKLNIDKRVYWPRPLGPRL